MLRTVTAARERLRRYRICGAQGGYLWRENVFPGEVEAGLSDGPACPSWLRGRARRALGRGRRAFIFPLATRVTDADVIAPRARGSRYTVPKRHLPPRDPRLVSGKPDRRALNDAA